MNIKLKKRTEELGLECSTVCSRDVYAVTDREKNNRSLSNVDMEKNRKDQLG